MARRRKPKPAPLPTLEEQLQAHDAAAPDGPQLVVGVFDDDKPFLADISPERMRWARKRLEIVDAIRRRDSKRMADMGRDASGNFDVNPYAARGHVTDEAPKNLGKEIPRGSQFPKRVVTQRMYDRYFRAGHLEHREWRAADALWRLWNMAGLEAKVTSGYEPVTTNGQASQDHKIAKRIDGALAYVERMASVPYRSRGVVTAVVVLDWSASQWAQGRGYGRSDSERLGMERLRQGLRALADDFGY